MIGRQCAHENLVQKKCIYINNRGAIKLTEKIKTIKAEIFMTLIQINFAYI